MELFHDVKIDWLGKKWYFLAFSLVFSVAGLLSIFFWHGIPVGIDFKGGTLVYVKFDAPPSADRIRDAVDKAGIRDSRIQPFGQRIGQGPSNEVIISLPEKQVQESNAEAGSDTIVKALSTNYSATGAANQNATSGKLDLDNVGSGTLADFLMQQDPEHLGPDAGKTKYTQQADAILSYRDRQGDGLIPQLRCAEERGRPGGGLDTRAEDLYFRLPCLQHGDCRAAGGSATARAGDTRDAVFAARHADLPVVAL